MFVVLGPGSVIVNGGKRVASGELTGQVCEIGEIAGGVVAVRARALLPLGEIHLFYQITSLQRRLRLARLVTRGRAQFFGVRLKLRNPTLSETLTIVTNTFFSTGNNHS